MRTGAKKIIIGILASLVLSLNATAIVDALKVKVINGTLTDETVIRFLPTATTGFDGSMDAYKLLSTSPTVPAAFTNLDSLNHLSINALPTMTSTVRIELFTHIKVAGTYTLQSIELGAFSPDVTIMLQDRFTGAKYAFRGGTSISFPMTVNTVATANRFVLYITPATIILARPTDAIRGTTLTSSDDTKSSIQDKEGMDLNTSSLNAFQNNGQLILTIQTEELSKVELYVFNTTGQVVSNYSGSVMGEYTNEIQIPASGCYIIRSIIGNKSFTKKLSIIL